MPDWILAGSAGLIAGGALLLVAMIAWFVPLPACQHVLQSTEWGMWCQPMMPFVDHEESP